MAQTPALLYTDEGVINHTPVAAVTAGDVVVVNGIVGVAANDIAAGVKGALAVCGVYKLPKTTAAIVAGLPVHWNPTGDPDSGTAGSGAANQLGIGTFAGMAVEATGSGDNYAIVQLNEASGLLAVNSVTAAGSVIGDAAQLSQGLNVVTGADGTKGVILPVAVPGMQVVVKGVTAGVLKVWPKTGSTINALSASAALSMTTGAMPLTFVASSATQWYTLPLVAS